MYIFDCLLEIRIYVFILLYLLPDTIFKIKKVILIHEGMTKNISKK